MIPYTGGIFGFSILFRVHGSAIYKALTPAFISACIYVILYSSVPQSTWHHPLFVHPYPMTALVTAFTFLLVFRANYSYNRWWEAYSTVYHMHSKWLDFATEVAAFHYQSPRYTAMKPPSFGNYPQIESFLLKDTDLYTSSNKHHALDGSSRTLFSASVENTKMPPSPQHAAAAPRLSTSIPEDAEHQEDVPDMDGNIGNSATPTTNLGRQISRQRLQRHHRQQTVQNIIQQLDKAEQLEKERQEQFDLLQLQEEELRLKQDKNKRGSNETAMDGTGKSNQTTTKPDNTAALATIPSSRVGATVEDTQEITTHTNNNKRRPLKNIQSRFQSYRERRRLQHQQQQHEQHNVAGDVARRRRSSRFSSLPSLLQSKPFDINDLTTSSQNSAVAGHSGSAKAAATTAALNARTSKSINRMVRNNNYHQQILFADRFDTATGKPYSIFTAVTRTQLRTGHIDPDQVPPLLFLEECAHLLSLLSAVAFSTLRNDLPYAESPLTAFEPGLPWPHVDPDAYKRRDKKGWEYSKLTTLVRFIVGASRTAKDRTLYNAARPFRVIGNVSDEEIDQLQQARGPLAKVSLVSMWLQELISREYQTGDSTGDIAAPIISRLYQFISEGMAGYNQARKIASIPFPFAHAQLTTLFLGVVDFMVIPVLMLCFVNDEWLGFVLNVLTVLCFTGLHEVAREIESPFQNVPNDVPLNNFQAQFNEGLMVMFYGYHPDAYWDVDETLEEVQNLQNKNGGKDKKKNGTSKSAPKTPKKSTDPMPAALSTTTPTTTKTTTAAQATSPEDGASIETVLTNRGTSTIPIQRNEEFTVEEDRDVSDKVGGNTRTLSMEELDMLQAKERQQKLEELQQQQRQDSLETTSSSERSRLHHHPNQQQVTFLVPMDSGESSSLVFTKDDTQISGGSDDFSVEEPSIA